MIYPIFPFEKGRQNAANRCTGGYIPPLINIKVSWEGSHTALFHPRRARPSYQVYVPNETSTQLAMSRHLGKADRGKWIKSTESL